MATKAELENVHERYVTACGAVARAEADRDLHAAVRAAGASLPLVHAAVTYQRRYLKVESPVAPTLDCVLRCAPPLFLRGALDALEDWYMGGTRTERAALPDLPDRLGAARRLLAEATGLWAALAAGPGASLGLDGRCPTAAALVSVWLAVGAVAEARCPGRSEFTRASDPRRPATGKCGACGHLLAVPLVRLLDPFPCPTCRRPQPFVIVGRPA